MAIIPDAFTTGFEERMSTFSQEVRALNPVRIVVMEIRVGATRMSVKDVLVGAMGRAFMV